MTRPATKKTRKTAPDGAISGPEKNAGRKAPSPLPDQRPAQRAGKRTAGTQARTRAESSLLSRPGFLIRRLHQIHCALFAEEVTDAAITPVQYSLLSTLNDHGELDQNSLAHYIGLERTSVAEVLPRLSDRGLLERRRSEQDGRIRLVRLTDAGRELVKAIQPAVLRAHARTIEALPAPERKELVRMMALLVASDTSERAPLLKHR
ncbi:MarR family transcriptional regulator [Corticibacter populi]|uniref:MarR family transcriptional regulator n=1 Tax=Corticibacter populi TaxID=1550736 RepID=A0A3M6QPV4_9BURK|nr:MarR family winged helix-turn-helix transcriptional regulator [Corticibacter populi]RMX04821.1 MarR family transcriptional regulator [Corticibacter populi]RZS33760.1 MarR family transcriptional regulator [Corticibacter populi]